MYKGFKNYKKRFDFAKGTVKIFKFSLFVFASIILILNLQIFPKLEMLASVAASNELNRLIQAAVSEYLASSPEQELVKITYDEQGNVTSLSAQNSALNRVRNELAGHILRRLSEKGVLQVTIPIGSIVGGSFLSGKGPGIKVKLASAQKYRAALSSVFEETGINQTRHVISIDLSLTTSLILPGKNMSVTLDDSYRLCETVIVGKVPDTYTKIHRLTDDINEEIIDDLYDFASLD